MALSLGLKIALSGRYQIIDEPRLLRDMIDRFHERGFQTAIVDRRYQGDIIIARRGPCLAGARYGDYGSTLDAEFRQNTAGIGPLVYLYGGASTPRPPRLLPMLTLSTQFILGRVGIAISREPVIALASGPGCAIPPDFFAGLRLWLTPAPRPD